LAVLSRTNAQLIPIQRALTAAGVPFWSPGQRVLLDDPCAREVLADLDGRPSVPVQMVVADLAARVEESADRGHEEPAVLATLLDLARLFQRQQPDGRAGQWLGWLPTALSDDPSGSGPADAVTLCSFHRAKGLEWAAVWVAGLEHGFVPIGRARSQAAQDEERRLLYVALTRAEVELHCSWARFRTFGSRPVPRDASPWLELVRATAGPTPRPGPGAGEWRSRLRDQRRRLGDLSGSQGRGIGRREVFPPPDPDLVSALHAWRAEVARAAGIPAYVVLHDATVTALASLRPHTTDELLRVPGLGPVKASRYGPTLLSLLCDRAAAG
jgi:DNA helicase-2/ATP-dependent DNA helicase PcrA